MAEGIAGVSHQSRGLIVYVESPAVAARVPPTLLGYPVKTIVTGPFYPLALPRGKTGRTIAGLEASKTDKWRPCPGGVSVGHPLITAGTLASRVYDATTGARLFLSNNHVLAASNEGRPRDPLLQPGKYDGGVEPRDRIGFLERFVEMKLSPEANLIDAAVGRPDSEADLSDEVLDIGVVDSMQEAGVGMTVAKSGRTTCYATALITDVNATMKVHYPIGDLLFEDQILTMYLGAPGDSGSLCVNVDTGAAVGLLFAGSDTLTLLNKITNVARLLNVTFGPLLPTPWIATSLTLGMSPLLMVGAVISSEEIRKLGEWFK